MNEIEDSFEDLINKILDLSISDTKKNKLIDRTYDILSKVTEIVTSQYKLNERISELEEYVYNDIESPSDDKTSFICPYCNRNVQVYMDNNKMDMACPFCKNEVELEWSRDND